MRLSLIARPLTSPNCASTQVINNDDVIKNYRGRRDAVTSVAGSIPIRARDLGTTQRAATGTLITQFLSNWTELWARDYSAGLYAGYI